MSDIECERVDECRKQYLQAGASLLPQHDEFGSTNNFRRYQTMNGTYEVSQVLQPSPPRMEMTDHD